MKKAYATLSALFFLFCFSTAQNAQVTGIIRDADTKEPLAGASVKYDKTKGAISDASGKFVLSIPVGPHDLIISFIGYKNDKREISLKPDEKLSTAKKRLVYVFLSNSYRILFGISLFLLFVFLLLPHLYYIAVA